LLARSLSAAILGHSGDRAGRKTLFAMNNHSARVDPSVAPRYARREPKSLVEAQQQDDELSDLIR
jgi:hypothetical protein